MDGSSPTARTMRLALYEALGPEIRASLILAPAVPASADQIGLRRAQLTSQVQVHFAAELRRPGGARGRALLSCVDVLLQFESVEHLAQHGSMTPARSRRVLITGLSTLLDAHR